MNTGVDATDTAYSETISLLSERTDPDYNAVIAKTSNALESMVRDALIRLNPEIAEDESRTDEIIYKLRMLFLSTNPQNLVTQNEAFKQMVFD